MHNTRSPRLNFRFIFIMLMMLTYSNAYASGQIHVDLPAPQLAPPADLPFEIPIGWWFVSGSVLLLGVIGIWLIKRHRYLAQKRLSLEILNAIDIQQPNALTDINQLLKRVSLYYGLPKYILAADSHHWHTLLKSSKSGQMTFDQAWIDEAYKPFDTHKHPKLAHAFQQFARHWITRTVPIAQKSLRGLPALKQEFTDA